MLHTLVVVMTIILSLLIIINLFLRVYYPEWMPLPMLDDVPEYVYLIIGIIAGFSAGRALKLYKKLKHENHYV
ncbi:MAG: hypothetical protein UW95_C0002G0070 [Parcubacteria group bacterium GW2011_GWC1_45_14]|nr:MAG: hypothetical protein UW95_C0002G0070 [Parcubacteria group bacterium GW2011_GWC1_45_14]